MVRVRAHNTATKKRWRGAARGAAVPAVADSVRAPGGTDGVTFGRIECSKELTATHYMFIRIPNLCFSTFRHKKTSSPSVSDTKKAYSRHITPLALHTPPKAVASLVLLVFTSAGAAQPDA